MPKRKASGRHSWSTMKREQESTINLYRVDRGFTWRELAKAANVSITFLLGLNSGVASPIYEKTGKNHYNGELKAAAQRIGKVLNASMEELFPRYICRIEREMHDDYLPEQIIDCTMSLFSQRSARYYDTNVDEAVILTDALLKAIGKLNKQQQKVIRMRFWEGYGLEECGQELCVTRSRIGQIELKALTLLREHRFLKHFSQVVEEEEQSVG